MANKKNQKKKNQSKRPQGAKNQGGKGQGQVQTGQKPKVKPEDLLTLEYPDGTEVACRQEGTFEVEGTEYMALVPQDGSGDVFIYRFHRDGEKDYHLSNEPDDAKFEAAVREFERLIGYEGEEVAEAAAEEAEAETEAVAAEAANAAGEEAAVE